MNDKQLGFILWAIGMATPTMSGLVVLIVGMIFVVKGRVKDAP